MKRKMIPIKRSSRKAARQTTSPNARGGRSQEPLENSFRQRRPLSFFEDESNGAEETLDSFDPSLSHSVFDYVSDEDAEWVVKDLFMFMLTRFLKSLEVIQWL